MERVVTEEMEVEERVATIVGSRATLPGSARASTPGRIEERRIMGNRREK